MGAPRARGSSARSGGRSSPRRPGLFCLDGRAPALVTERCSAVSSTPQALVLGLRMRMRQEDPKKILLGVPCETPCGWWPPGRWQMGLPPVCHVWNQPFPAAFLWRAVLLFPELSSLSAELYLFVSRVTNCPTAPRKLFTEKVNISGHADHCVLLAELVSSCAVPGRGGRGHGCATGARPCCCPSPAGGRCVFLKDSER